MEDSTDDIDLSPGYTAAQRGSRHHCQGAHETVGWRGLLLLDYLLDRIKPPSVFH